MYFPCNFYSLPTYIDNINTSVKMKSGWGFVRATIYVLVKFVYYFNISGAWLEEWVVFWDWYGINPIINIYSPIWHTCHNQLMWPPFCLVLLLLCWDYIGGYVLFILLHSFLFSSVSSSSFSWFPSHYEAMTTETTNVVSVPTAEDNQVIITAQLISTALIICSFFSFGWKLTKTSSSFLT